MTWKTFEESVRQAETGLRASWWMMTLLMLLCFTPCCF